MRLSRLLRLTLPFLIAAGCARGNTSPVVVTNFNARHAFSKIDPLAAVLDQPLFTSFNRALSSFETYFRSASVGTLAVVPTQGAFDGRLTRTLVPATQVRASAIPDNVKGKTFTWDADSRTYLPDATLTGAPSNGVRFVLYTWDGVDGPTLPLARLGYVDIAPAEGAVAGQELTELSMFRDAPFLPVADFVVMHSMVGDVSNFGIEGSATDGFTVDLIDLSGTESGPAGQHQLVYNTTLSSSPATVSANEQLTSDQATATQGGRLTLSYEGHTLTDQTARSGAEVTFDGNVYAQVIFPATINDPTQYLRPDGTPLPQQEIADLNALIDRAVVANFFWIALAYP